MTKLMRMAVLASGRGSNLAALIAARDVGRLPADLVMVGSDNPEADALRLAEAANIPTLGLVPTGYTTRRAYDLDLLGRLQASGAELLVLAGFMRIIDADALASWNGRIINIHPSLLPKYRGLHTHRRALDAGDTEHGASVHFVTAELDGGPLIAQARLTIQPDDNENTLAKRLLPLEHRLLPAVVELLATRRLTIDQYGVMLDDKYLQQSLQLSNDQLLIDST